MQNQTPHGAYDAHQRSEDEPLRETEARALLSCASKLEDSRNEEVPRETYIAALRHNQRLWTVFQAALCEEENKLPQDLKMLLLNLSRYVDKVTFRAIQEQNRELVRSLININRTIAKGLQQNSEQQTQTQPQQSAPQMSNEAPPKPISTSV